MASHETENIFKQQQILLKPINKIGVASTWKETENRQLEVSETEAPLGGFLDQSMSTLPPQTTVTERGRTIRANHCDTAFTPPPPPNPLKNIIMIKTV